METKEQLTSREIAEVFKLYVPCPVELDNMGSKVYNRRMVAVGGFEDGTGHEYCTLAFRGSEGRPAATIFTAHRRVRLMLTPLSGLTDDQLLDLLRAATDDVDLFRFSKWEVARESDPKSDFAIATVSNPRHYLRYQIDLRAGGILAYNKEDRLGGPDPNEVREALYWQWYYRHGVAVPLYFGRHHWANEQTPIDLGIAVDINSITDPKNLLKNG